MRSIPALLALAALGTMTGCGMARQGAELPAGSNSDRIGYEEIQQRGQYSNLYDLIEVLRPRWLRPQGGPDTFSGDTGQVQVHMDGNWMGDIGVLASLSVAGVTSIRWVTPMDASSRYGLDHSHGAIVISTRPVH